MSSDLSAPRNLEAWELLVPHQPEIIILSTPEDVDRYAAQYVVEQVQQKPDSALVLPTGNTPIGMYEMIAQARRDGAVDFDRVTTFNLDEYWPLPQGHPDSYREYMWTHFYDRVNIRLHNTYIPNSHVFDSEFEAIIYETMLKLHGPVDLAVLGIGPGLTCHVGFNEVGSPVDSRTRLVQLSEDTIATNRPLFAKPEDMPPTAFTMGIANILESKRVMLIAKGARKAGGIRRALEGDIGPEAPASFLRFHPNATFVIDNAAAHLLTNRR